MSGSGDHLTYAPITRRFFKLQKTSPWSCKNLFQWDVRSTVHPLAGGRVSQPGTIEGTLTYYDVGSSTRLSQEVFGGSRLLRHAPENYFSGDQLPKMPALVNLIFLLCQDLLFVPIEDSS